MGEESTEKRKAGGQPRRLELYSHIVRYHVAHLGDGECGDPDGLLYGVDADVAVPAHVGMEDPGEEADLRRVEGVGEGHLQVQEEIAALVGAAHRAAY